MKTELLKNNSNEMGTFVETFLIEETVELIYDNEQLEKWNKMVEDLGLIGQTQIVQKDKSPIPFMHLKTNIKAVFETLCPRKVDVKDYNVTPIPVEILDLISLSVNEGYFDKLQIWYDEKSPDPVCIGLKGEYMSYKTESSQDYSSHFKTKKEAEDASELNGLGRLSYFMEWGANAYLLGKWADVKHSFEELTKMATKRFIQEKSHVYQAEIVKNQRALDDLKSEAFTKFGSDVHGADINSDLPF